MKGDVQMYTQKEWEEQNMTTERFLEKMHIKGISSVHPGNCLESLWKKNRIYRMDMLKFDNNIVRVIYFDKQMRYISDEYLAS